MREIAEICWKRVTRVENDLHMLDKAGQSLSLREKVYICEKLLRRGSRLKHVWETA